MSVKTLFQHFSAKEDLLIAGLAEIHDDMLAAVSARDRDSTPLQAVTDWVVDWELRRTPDGFDRFVRMVGTGPSVEAMRRRLYDEWESALVAVLADEARGAADAADAPNGWPAHRVDPCAQLPEVRALLERYPPGERGRAHDALTLEAAALLADGLDRTRARARARPERPAKRRPRADRASGPRTATSTHP